MSRSFTNPFYSNNNGGNANAPPPPGTQPTPPPAYSRPTPASHSSGGPVSYGSLSDLTRGRGQAAPSTFAYTPDASRQGYRNDHDSGRPGGAFGGNAQNGYGGQEGQSGRLDANGRRMPPAPGNHGVGIPPEPPRRNVAPGERGLLSLRRNTGRPLMLVDRTSNATPPTRLQTAQKTASGYIPNSVSATAYSMGDKVRDGFDSIATQQRREQVCLMGSSWCFSLGQI